MTKRKAPAKQPKALPEQLENFDRLPDSAYVREPVVCLLYDISRMTVRRWSETGRLPAAEKLGPGVRAYSVGALRAARVKRIA
jgi:hypothetical protein